MRIRHSPLTPAPSMIIRMRATITARRVTTPIFVMATRNGSASKAANICSHANCRRMRGEGGPEERMREDQADKRWNSEFEGNERGVTPEECNSNVGSFETNRTAW